MTDTETRFICAELQDEIDEWNQRQPWAGDSPAVVTLGLAEESGELCRAVLKMHQQIRGTEDEWMLESEKEMGDVFIKLCCIANSLGIDLEKAIKERWTEVRKRNWSTDRTGHGLPEG